jgi:glucose-6-phosphate isomerase
MQVGAIHIDHSKQRLDAAVWQALLALAETRQVSQGIARMFAGEKINHTEGRAVLHVALRAPAGNYVVDGKNILPEVHAVQARMRAMTEEIQSGAWRGVSGQKIERVINIGIGGSDLGPRMVCTALNAHTPMRLDTRFVANVDPTDLALALRGADPHRTLFVVTSKTFTTTETLMNAQAARAWLQATLGEDVGRHFVAISAFPERAAAFGIPPAQVLPMWDWVGGRYSLWSAVGLPIALAFGYEVFAELLAGAHLMDEHVRQQQLNMAVQMALIAHWNSDYLGASSQLVIPYSEALARLPAFLQQLELESNGKRVNHQGELIQSSVPALWGEVGSNSQHAFFQWLHQGTQIAPVDFIVLKQQAGLSRAQTQTLNANALAQARALMLGQTHADPHREFPGNRPSSMIVLDSLNAHSLGQLIALYEHKVLVQGILWGINSFDQFGVELGKAIANQIVPVLQKNAAAESKIAEFDDSTQHLLHILAAAGVD